MSKSSKKILVTGAAGFLGSHLSEKLMKLGHDVVGIDNMTGGYKDNVPDYADRSLLTSTLSMIPDGGTLANGVTDSITKLINFKCHKILVGIGIEISLYIL